MSATRRKGDAFFSIQKSDREVEKLISRFLSLRQFYERLLAFLLLLFGLFGFQLLVLDDADALLRADGRLTFRVLGGRLQDFFRFDFRFIFKAI